MVISNGNGNGNCNSNGNGFLRGWYINVVQTRNSALKERGGTKEAEKRSWQISPNRQGRQISVPTGGGGGRGESGGGGGGGRGKGRAGGGFPSVLLFSRRMFLRPQFKGRCGEKKLGLARGIWISGDQAMG